MKYIAFLRGINVGGNTLIKMDALRNSFEALGFENVKTLLASGNVVFETTITDVNALTKKIEEKLKDTFGFPITVMLRSREEVAGLINANPFKNIEVTANTRQHVTFLSEQQKTHLKIPYESAEDGFNILYFSGKEVCSTVEVSSTGGTPELMKMLEQEFGKKVTTRTWNTVNKVWKLLE
jgi:uncharacterized protein (DUF1697 family)